MERQFLQRQAAVRNVLYCDGLIIRHQLWLTKHFALIPNANTGNTSHLQEESSEYSFHIMQTK